MAGSSYEAALDRFDQEMIGGLKKSVDPLRVLRDLLKGARPRSVEEVGAKKKEE